jgi:hypothetical protein
MKDFPPALDLSKVKVFPLAERRSLSALESVLIPADSPAPACSPAISAQIQKCTQLIRRARERQASVMLIYGAHLVKNGLLAVVNDLIRQGWITHLATNGAGVIHDWELSYLGRTEESVRENVATGSFGTWDETGRCIQLALLTGALRGEGFGRSVGRFMMENGTTLPTTDELDRLLRSEPAHPLAPARAELLQTMLKNRLPAGRHEFNHPHRGTSIVATAFAEKVPLTVHPGIGYDIFATHPMFSGAAVGRAAQSDFAQFSAAVEGLDEGVALSVGSAIMGPQVFEKSLSCVNNLRLQAGRPRMTGHTIYVVDIQDGGNWDWTQGEPPKTNPAYYLRFCKSYARMGGEMNYLQCDNVAFFRQLSRELDSGADSRGTDWTGRRDAVAAAPIRSSPIS